MLEFAPNTYMLEYQNGAYLCNGTKQIEAPLNLDTLEEAVRQCPKLQQVLLDDALFGDQCFSVLARVPIAGERVTKSKFWLYAEQDIFYYRYLMRLIDDKWMIDNAQWCQKGRWSFCGL